MALMLFIAANSDGMFAMDDFGVDSERARVPPRIISNQWLKGFYQLNIPNLMTLS
ncbi:MAG: hypothetical protein ACI92E_002389 [Oceanicoccus sp.]|jgi:hypothetical protein